MKKVRIVFWLLLVLQLINILVWSIQKEGYYIDELWSYGLANSYYEPFLNEIEGHQGTWHEPDYYLSYLGVDEGEGFSYDSVYYNQVEDVHPPVYYFLLHTVCSLFPGVFSKWFGLSLNIIFFVGSIWILFKIGEFIWGENKLYSVIPMLLYGFSLGAMNTVLYIRMYMLLVFWVLLFTYLSMLWWKKESGYKVLLGLTITTICGFLSQYFFIIFIFFLCGSLVLWQIFFGKWKEALKYAASVVSGLVVAVLLFPAAVSHMLSGDKGQEVMAQAAENIFEQYGKQFLGYTKAVSEEFFGIQVLWILFTVLLILSIILIFTRLCKALKEKDYGNVWVPVSMLLGAAIGYFLVVVKIAPEVATRYQCAVYPFLWTGFTYLLWYLLNKIKKKRLLIAFVVCVLVLSGIRYPEGLKYLYSGTEEKIDGFAENYGMLPGYYVTEDSYDHVVIGDCLLLQQQASTYIVDVTDRETLQQLAEQQGDEIVVYVSVFYQEQIVNTLMEIWNYARVEEVMGTDFTKVLVFFK